MEVKQVLSDLEKIRPQVAMLGVSVVFLLAIVLMMEGLKDILWPIFLLFLIVLAPFMLLRTYGSRLMARAIVHPLRSHSDLEESELESVLGSVNGFAIRESFWIFFLWFFGSILVQIAAWFWLGTTSWQMILIGTVAIISGIIEALLTYHADLRLLGVLREEIDFKLGSRSRTSSSLVPKLLGAYLSIVFMVLSVTIVVWIDRASSAKAQEILDRDSITFLATARHLSDSLQPGQTPAEALANAMLEKKSDWVNLLVSGSGEILAGKFDADQRWLGRVIKSGSTRWLDKRAPFLYMRSPLRNSIHLFWVRDNKLASEIFWTTGIWALLVGILMAVLGLLLARTIIISSVRPLRKLANKLKNISENTISRDLLVGGAGEVAELSKGMDEFVRYVRTVLQAGKSMADAMQQHKGRLADRIDSLRRSSEHRATLAEQTAASILQMRMSVDSISEQVDSLRQSSTDCSSSLFEIEQSVREVSSSVENFQNLVDDAAGEIVHITNSMKTVAKNMNSFTGRADDTNATVSAMAIANAQVEKNISETNSLIEQVSEIASQGAQSVEETIEGINDIQLVTHEARDVINSLSQQMKAVGKILTVISDVAQQTNLLALNAAIIAAAAGEHGKGFAVVADEIKDLADRTASSTKEISSLIKSVQADSRRAVSAMERGSNSVNHGVHLANNAGAALQQILAAVSEVLRMSGEIHESTKAHGHLSTSISRSMADMADMLRDIRQAISEQAASGERVNRVAEQLKDDARFVGRSASEQVQAVTGVSRSMERISEMVGFVSKAIVEQAQGISHVAKAAEEVRDSSSMELQRLADVEETVDRIGRSVHDLKNQSKFEDGQEHDI